MIQQSYILENDPFLVVPTGRLVYHVMVKDKDYQLTDASSTRIEGNFFSVAMTTPLEAAVRNQFIKRNLQFVLSSITISSCH